MKQIKRQIKHPHVPSPSACLLVLLTLIWLAQGCALAPKKVLVKDSSQRFDAGDIISARTGKVVTFQKLINHLGQVRVVYIGEKHTDTAHHDVQLKIIKALWEIHPDLMVGMEMFDHSYQEILEQWSGGRLSMDLFLEKTHWYANWRYNHRLYEKILEFIKEKNIPLVGLNLPFHLPAKIRVGGIDSLSAAEKQHLAVDIDITQADHKAYVERIYHQHKAALKYKFAYFYQAQCAWDDTMAEVIARSLGDRVMVVLAGNGHIIKKFGIPERAHRRTHVPYQTVYPISVGQTAEWSFGDYIWVTP